MKHETKISAFVQKLWNLLEASQNTPLCIHWVDNGTAFKIDKSVLFSSAVLPRYFKHNNLTSFIRQLNMYNFHKVRTDISELCFRHQLFKRDFKELLKGIKRKPTQSDLEYGRELLRMVQDRNPTALPSHQREINQEMEINELRAQSNSNPPGGLGKQNQTMRSQNDSTKEQVRRLKGIQEMNLTKVHMLFSAFRNFPAVLTFSNLNLPAFMDHFKSEEPAFQTDASYLRFIATPFLVCDFPRTNWLPIRLPFHGFAHNPQ